MSMPHRVGRHCCCSGCDLDIRELGHLGRVVGSMRRGFTGPSLAPRAGGATVEANLQMPRGCGRS